MRLTLRTLLAYLDDQLDPSEAQLLGEQIKNSALAKEMIDRIREVIRRRRLTAPNASGPGVDVDANLVAEYLDNTLPPQGVNDLEQICLDSDLHLAEVAACHQILTLFLGDPIEIPVTSRERMYALSPEVSPATTGPGAPTISMATSPTVSVPVVIKPAVTTPAPTAAPAARTAPAPASGGAGKTPVASTTPAAFHDNIPDYLKPTPAWKKLVPMLVVTVVLAAWAGALYFDPTLMQGLFPAPPATANNLPAGQQQVAAIDDQAAEVQPTDNESTGAAVLSTSNSDVPPADTQVAAVVPETTGAKVPMTVTVPSLDPEPPADAVETPRKPVATATTETTPDSEQPVTPTLTPEPETTTPGKTTTVASVDPDAVPPRTPRPMDPKLAVAEYISQDGLVLLHDAAQNQWYPLPYRSQIHAKDRLAVPEPFSALWWVGQPRHRVTAIGPSVVMFNGAMSEEGAEFTLEQGRLLLQPADPRTTTDVPLPFMVQVGLPGGIWKLELLTAETTVGLDLESRQPQHVDALPVDLPWRGRLYLSAGQLRATGPDQRLYELNAPAVIDLAAKDNLPPERPVLPGWMQDSKPSTIAQVNGRHLEKEFAVNETAHDALMGLVEDRRPEIARLAVSCLGLVGDYSVLVQALDRSEHEEARQASIQGLRSWLGNTPGAGTLLQEELNASFYPAEAEAVARLLWGYSEKDARDPQISYQLVEWLNHDRLAIRELAWYYIRQFSGRRFEYRPDGPIRQRRQAVQQWVKILEKDKALIASPMLPTDSTKSTSPGTTASPPSTPAPSLKPAPQNSPE